MKIVINTCHGGFGLSREAESLYRERKADLTLNWYSGQADRTDPVLIQVIEELGVEKASGKYAKLEIEDIPAGTLYRIDEYDGMEYVEYRDDIEWKVAT